MAERLPSFVSACGALGSFDRARVLAIAAAFEREPQVVHDDPRAILAIDRPPIRWAGDGLRALGWEEQPRAALPGAATIADAAGGCCVLALGPGGASLRSTISGFAPLYVMPEGGAAYFATSIDPLVRASPGPLTVDWEAWAGILTLGYALGDRTPFAEIRRLGPASSLRIAGGRARVSAERWAWAEVAPSASIEDGSDAVLEAMRGAIARIPEGATLCQLSGGLDSRLCLGLLIDADRTVSAIVADDDSGSDAETRVAAAIAKAFGVPNEVVIGDAETYWDELAEHAARVDFQLVRPPWRMPMLGRMRRAGATVVDGFGFDVLAAPGDRVLNPATADPRGGDDVVRALWEATSGSARARPGSTALQPELARALWASAERQYLATSQRFSGNPARALLTFYASRQLRGVALAPACALGRTAPVAVPLVDDDVARAALAIGLESKRGGRLYDALFAAIDPRLATLPSTRREAIPDARPRIRRSQSAPIAEAFEACLADGPLTPYLLPGKRKALTRHRRGGEPRVPAALLGPAYFHLWHRRYRDRLGDVDPADVAGATAGAGSRA